MLSGPDPQGYLKLCPSCDTILVRGDSACVKCGSHGPFTTDPEKLIGLLRLVYAQGPMNAAVQISDSD